MCIFKKLIALTGFVMIAFGSVFYVANVSAEIDPFDVVEYGTPDGVTPAEELTCQGLDGRAKGLCIAYCEAMDCHLNSDSPSQSCTKLKGKLEAMNLPGGIPCEEPSVVCPCFSFDELNAFPAPFQLCIKESHSVDVTTIRRSSSGEIYDATSAWLSGDNYPRCNYLVDVGGDIISRFESSITEAQYGACNSLIDAVIELKRNDCKPPIYE